MSFTRPATLARAALLGLAGLGLAAAPALSQAKKPAAPAP
ncbi:invasion associated locus B family protein, partial [Methylobacterium sp. WL7]